ncbi:peptidoglycan bridge formation glycyltransferase FemA/FemB family protein [Ornithinibacillus halophilus]|uniref:Lipid II:glycine glycyltransferase n=1 Tax=Ornithinibacillus halophilus TaxID=930117 RepID=A0A1M5KKP5_9BACI|nr:peptidoglycan bridge formation glycyltransferase FemA/FemB family protein [Ornithinibacillus halophilus]SHG53331.1 FemAB family protein [Ornithinibacillus halophilus]
MGIQWKKYIFTINEIFGTNDSVSGLGKADAHTFYQQQELVEPERKLAVHRQVVTLLIDVTKTEEALRKDMNRTTRYQINKASRDELTVEVIDKPTMDDVLAFEGFFNPFADEKGIERCRTDRVRGLMESGMLVITYVYDKEGRKLASHLYISNGQRAAMLYSCSGRFTNADVPPIVVGRANRYLHWQDILYFKHAGYQYYDFLGLSINEEDKEEQNINKFKKGFGGKEVTEYQSYIPQNGLGKMLVLILKFRWRNQLEVKKGKEVHRRKRKEG